MVREVPRLDTMAQAIHDAQETLSMSSKSQIEDFGNVGFSESRTNFRHLLLHPARRPDSQVAIAYDPNKERGFGSEAMSRLVGTSCDLSCRCGCHSHIQIRSPSSLRNVLGSLLVRYTAFPSLKQVYSDPQCRSRIGKTICVYSFRPWLLNWAIAMSYLCTRAKGPEFLLRVMRVSDFHTISRVMLLPQPQATQEMKAILDSGAASVADVDQYGRTILH